MSSLYHNNEINFRELRSITVDIISFYNNFLDVMWVINLLMILYIKCISFKITKEEKN